MMTLPSGPSGPLQAPSTRSLVAAWYRGDKSITTQNSNPFSVAQDAFQEGIAVFARRLTKDIRKRQQAAQYLHTSINDVLELVNNARETYDKRRGSSKARDCVASFAQRICHYGNVLDVFVQQHPEYVSLAWGATKFVFGAVVEHEKTGTTIVQALCEVADALPRVELAAILYPTDGMKRAVASLYAHIIRFLIRALDWYKEGTLLHIVHSITRPVALRYADIITAIQKETALIEKLSTSCGQAELRDMHYELLATRATAEAIRTEAIQERQQTQIRLDTMTDLIHKLQAAVTQQNWTLLHLNGTVSGIEVAGLVMGALPLVVSALDKYKTAGNAFKRFASKWTYEISCLSRCVKTQLVFYRLNLKMLLVASGEQLPAGSDPADLLTQPAVQKQLAKYLKESGAFEVFQNVLGQYKSSLDVLVQRLDHVQKGPESKYNMAAVLAANIPHEGKFNFGKRFAFAMKQAEMREETERLDNCNETLRRLTERILGRNHTKARGLTKEEAARKLAKDSHNIRHRAIGLHAAIDACWTAACQCTHTFMPLLECRVVLDHAKTHAHEVTFHSLLACGDAAKVLLQQCSEISIHFDQNMTPANKQALTDLFKGLTQAVSNGEAMTLESDRSQKSQLDSQTMQDSISLEKILVDCMRIRPQQRTVLAIDIASSLLQLQTTPWLETSLTKKVIRFAQYGSAGQQLIEYNKPFIARAFPDSGPSHTDGSVKTDLLELGILLLEVWNLQTFECWTSKHRIDLKPGYNARVTPAIQWLEDSESDMTAAYADAVSVCVKSSFGGVPQRWDHPEFRRIFCEKVLGSLQENCKAWIR